LQIVQELRQILLVNSPGATDLECGQRVLLAKPFNA